MSGVPGFHVERQFWESFEGWARRRMAQRLENAAEGRRLAAYWASKRMRWPQPVQSRPIREQIALAREVRLGLAASIARGSALGLPQ